MSMDMKYILVVWKTAVDGSVGICLLKIENMLLNILFLPPLESYKIREAYNKS